MRATRVKSISMNEVTCADVCREATMCSLVRARILDIGSTTSPGQGCGVGSWDAGCAMRDAGSGVAGAPDSMNPRMSRFVTRPATPEPCNEAMLTPCSAAIFLTSGDDLVLTRSSKELPLPECDAAMAGAAGGCREGAEGVATSRWAAGVGAAAGA